jgi:TatD DNase family protein
MELIDSHTHLYCDDFLTEEQPKHPKKGVVLPPPAPTPNGGAEAVERALAAGVTHMIFPANALYEIELMKQLAAKFPGKISMAMGLHPTELTDDPVKAIDIIEQELLQNPGKYCAVGEIGIDLYWEPEHRQQQMEAFSRQCRLALQLDLPIIIHCRDGLDEVLEVLRSLPSVPSGVFHSFGGTVEDVARIREVGDFYFGINGILTFKSSTLRDVLPTIGIDRILLETDSPYLAPVPYRGRRNQSAYLPEIAYAVATALTLPIATVASRTLANTRRLFPRLPQP